MGVFTACTFAGGLLMFLFAYVTTEAYEERKTEQILNIRAWRFLWRSCVERVSPKGDGG